MKWIFKFIIFAVAVYLAAYFVPGIAVSGVKGALVTSVVLGLLNTFVKPFVKMLAFPVNFRPQRWRRKLMPVSTLVTKMFWRCLAA